jgi:ABC-type Mn2+/Zn2+ transport system ATPase subunit
MHVTAETRLVHSPRTAQVAGLFDLEETSRSRLDWHLADDELAVLREPWHVGLVTGPSGAGKSTLAHALFPHSTTTSTPDSTPFLWSDSLSEWCSGSIIDGFPEHLSIKEVCETLCAVGFASPPAWLRPYRHLSTGQRFRADLARLLCSLTPSTTGVFDEYTSVVDRTVAKVGSHAVAKAVRRRNLRFVAVTCHDDVLEWLQPDWVLRINGPGVVSLTRRSVQRRPRVGLRCFRTTPEAWGEFAHHHYLSHRLSRSAVCFGCEVQLPGERQWKPAGFSAWVNHVGALGGRREHRTVVLPDYQGIGIGMALSAFCASIFAGLGERVLSTTTHPSFNAARSRSSDWVRTRKAGLSSGAGSAKRGHATTRLTTGWRYVGPTLPRDEALAILRG